MSALIKEPKITLVGAGPGDPELITLKGLKALRQADVILYDALVNEDLLKEAPHAKTIYVGKRKGHKALTQKEINSLIVDSALKYGHVVRLKGGDSFVFGRGFEEIQFIQRFGIPVEVIPGVSSSIAAPALANIPVTHRGVSHHFTVITATLSDGSLNPEIEKIAPLNGTLVILMGLNKLEEIATLVAKAGKPETPFAVISNGSLKSQCTVFGTAKSITKQVTLSGLSAPATIVIGEVVTFGEQQQSKNFTLNYN